MTRHQLAVSTPPPGALGVLRASAWFFVVRLVHALILAAPIGLTLRSLSGRHPDADAALFSDFAARVADVGLREPRSFSVPLTALGIGLLLVPLGEGVVDRVGAGMLRGARGGEAIGDGVSEAFRIGPVSLFGTLFRGAALTCVVGLFRHREWTPAALALPLTLSLLLVLFTGVVLGLRDTMCWPGVETLRVRLRVALLVLLHAPLRMVLLALGTRALGLAFAAIAFVASTSPTPLTGAKLIGVYALAGGCFFAGALCRALRFAGLGALAEAVTPRDARTDDPLAEPDAPSPDPTA